jgi:extradiol dioxygenase family protein
MSEPRLQAIQNVVIEAGPDLADHLREFYGQLVGLREAVDDDRTDRLCFQSGQLQLQIQLRATARPNCCDRRATVEVPSLEELRRHLDERKLAYECYQGLAFTEQRVFVLDPAGYRIEFKQVQPL